MIETLPPSTDTALRHSAIPNTDNTDNITVHLTDECPQDILLAKSYTSCDLINIQVPSLRTQNNMKSVGTPHCLPQLVSVAMT